MTYLSFVSVQPEMGRGRSETEIGPVTNYRVARRPCGRPALSELGVKVSLHPAQALRTPL